MKKNKIEIKHLLGDVKWVLYQHVITLNNENNLYTFRCGSYAFNKISKLFDFKADNSGESKSSGELNLNGEQVFVIRIWDIAFDKNKLIISEGCELLIKNEEQSVKVFPNDIVLYFA